MAKVNKIDSNATGLRFAEESSPKTLGGSPVFYPLEPNSYDNFGGEISTVARNPINQARQNRKGVVTDLSAAGGFNTDITQKNLQRLLQGFFFADAREKAQQEVTDVDGTSEAYTVADESAFEANNLVFGAGFDNASNNGLKSIASLSAGTITVNEDLVDETPSGTPTVTKIGVRADAADIDVDISLDLPALVSSTLDFTTLDLVVGEWIFIGGDNSTNQFNNAANNGFKRIRSISANRLVLDKSVQSMVDETGTGLEIDLYFGRVVKNESDPSLIKRRTYHLERSLGVPDTANPGQTQYEYLVGSVPSELALNASTADKLTADLNFLAFDHEQQDAGTGAKSGTRPAIEGAAAFNTSSDFSRLKLSSISNTDEAPDPLFAFVEELTLNVNNNLTENKAISVLGSFDISAGQFGVSGNLTAYFSDIAAIQAVRNNSDVSLDAIVVKSNAGIAIDLPLLTLGDGRANVEQDQAIRLPINYNAATGADAITGMDHTLLFSFFDYLPDLAA